jgi:hypothetical protein
LCQFQRDGFGKPCNRVRLLALYALWNGEAVMECVDAVLMIRPSLRLHRRCQAAMWNAAVKLSAMIASHLSSEKSSTGDILHARIVDIPWTDFRPS